MSGPSTELFHILTMQGTKCTLKSAAFGFLIIARINPSIPELIFLPLDTYEY